MTNRVPVRVAMMLLLIATTEISHSQLSQGAKFLPPIYPLLLDDVTASDTDKPNVILIIADDLGFDSSAQYDFSNDLPNTPTLNSLAEDGLVFDNAWATPACTTTRGTLISGQHGINSGVDTVPNLMDTSTLTLQRYLANSAITSNYQSAIFGKWHLAGPGSDLDHPNESGVPYYAGNIAGVLNDYRSWPLVTNGVMGESTQYHTSAVTDMAINWVDAQNEPWFLWLAYVAPHSPFHLPPSNLHSRNLSGQAADINANPRDYYLAAIEAMDTEIGRLLDSLSAQERENTLIIYIGDNGTPSRVVDTAVFPRSRVKNTLYEGGIRIPMTVSGAGVSRKGEREAALVNTVDVYPTIIDAVGAEANTDVDGLSFHSLLSDASVATRPYNYSEFVSANVTGWTTRNETHKLIEFADGTQELYSLVGNISDDDNLIATNTAGFESIINDLSDYAAQIRGGTTPPAPIDITNTLLTATNTSCVDYANAYSSNVTDINNDVPFTGDLVITADNDHCFLSTNAIPNHDFNDGVNNFANPVAAQNDEYRITTSPTFAADNTGLLLTQDNAVLLNGVKVDLLAAACFGVGDERVGCNNINQPWRFDPMYAPNGFRVDSHNAHTQPNGSYHYHGQPEALFDGSSIDTVVGFAADGFPIFSSFIDAGGAIDKVVSSYRLKSGLRPSGVNEPGGTYDGTYRDDYEYVENLSDLDECNGMERNGSYGYYITDAFPYILSCFKGTPDASFLK